MQTVAMYFSETIEKYRQLKQVTDLLTEEMPLLAPHELGSRCRVLSELQREINNDNHQLCLLMEEIGPEILDTASIGEYQRAMDKSILACDMLQAGMRFYRDRIHDHSCPLVVPELLCQAIEG
ncbi:MAG: hypothetical protein JZU50_09815 [Desulfobulbaceae bacterium]|nr:hypothetical protein [Desulfobulbaceae bacterium]